MISCNQLRVFLLTAKEGGGAEEGETENEAEGFDK